MDERLVLLYPAFVAVLVVYVFLPRPWWIAPLVYLAAVTLIVLSVPRESDLPSYFNGAALATLTWLAYGSLRPMRQRLKLSALAAMALGVLTWLLTRWA